MVEWLSDESLQWMYHTASEQAVLTPFASPDPHLHLAEVALQIGHVSAAQMHAEDALVVDALCARAWWVLGMAYDAQRELDQAAWSYVRALRLEPHSAARGSLCCLTANDNR